MKQNKIRKGRYTPAQLATVITFMAVILGFFALLLFLPKHAGEMSDLEFRALADHPIKGVAGDVLARRLVRGELSDNVDTFLEDHFPARSFFIALNSYGSRLAGRNAVQNVVAGKNGRMFDEAHPVSFDMVDKNLASIDGFAEANGLDTELVIVPSSAVSVTDDLPLVHPVYRDEEAIAHAAETSKAHVMDLKTLYDEKTDDTGSLFYRTDHHWTMDGAYIAYEDICSRMGVEPVKKADFTVEDYEFYGSFYRKAGMWLAKPDTLEVWRSPALEKCLVTIGTGERAEVHEGAYDEAKLRPDCIDKYAAYLYSNNGVTVIRNPEAEGEPVMIVKDSFGNSIAPLFVSSCSTVVMIDTRYYTTALDDPSALCARYGIRKLIVVLGTDSFVTESYLAYLR